MLYESARVTLAADYRIATLTVVGGADSPIGRATLNDLDAALAAAARNPALDVLVLRGDTPGARGGGVVDRVCFQPYRHRGHTSTIRHRSHTGHLPAWESDADVIRRRTVVREGESRR